jgi:hypothetical protein
MIVAKRKKVLCTSYFLLVEPRDVKVRRRVSWDCLVVQHIPLSLVACNVPDMEAGNKATFLVKRPDDDTVITSVIPVYPRMEHVQYVSLALSATSVHTEIEM